MENLDYKQTHKNPFTVPEGYFSQLTERVMDRIHENQEEEKKPFRKGWMYTLRPYLGLAALFVMALFVVQIILPHFVDDNRMIDKSRTNGTEMAQETPTDPNEKTDDPALDSRFNPTHEEIMEYLSTELNEYDLIYAGLY